MRIGVIGIGNMGSRLVKNFLAAGVNVGIYEADFENPVAEYENEPQGWWDKFVYYVLETNKTSYIKRVIGIEGDHIKIEDGKSGIVVSQDPSFETEVEEGTVINVVIKEKLKDGQ